MLVEHFGITPRAVGDGELSGSSLLSSAMIQASNTSVMLSSVARMSFESNESALRDGGSVRAGEVNETNAKNVLVHLKRLPKSENTFQGRLTCLLADPSIETWQAFTYPSNEELVAQKAHGAFEFKEFLGRPGVWLPEIENINHNILSNFLVRAADKYAASFVDLMLGDGRIEVSDVVIARGAPAVGKTSYLANNFAVAADDAKTMIQHRIQGLTNDQVHFQGTTIVQQFEHALNKRFSLVLTSDALYLTVDAVENKLNAIVDSGKEQRVSVRDIQVDLATLCCRVLKRGADEPRMTFAMVSNYVKSSIQNRQVVIDLLEQRLALVKDYSLLVWDAGKYIEVARFCPEKGKIIALDKTLFDKCTSFENGDAGIEDVRHTVIDESFVRSVVKDLDSVEAQRFVVALKVYEGRTLEEAMFIHSRDTRLEGGVGGRVLKGVLF